MRRDRFLPFFLVLFAAPLCGMLASRPSSASAESLESYCTALERLNRVLERLADQQGVARVPRRRWFALFGRNDRD